MLTGNRRFQRHQGFVFLCFDLGRRKSSALSAKLQTYKSTWSRTKPLLESLTPEQLTTAADLAQKHQPITDEGVKELLKLVNKVGIQELGSDEKKVSMLAQLKSAVVYYGSPLVFLTLNPGDLHSALALLYAGESIRTDDFHPSLYPGEYRTRKMLDNPLAVVEYFHTLITAVINNLVNNGLFGDVAYHYGTIEYQGRGTPHIHLLVSHFIICKVLI
jgi:hypothetical protein